MLPELRTKVVLVDGIGELTVREMSARCFAEWSDARDVGKKEVEVSAIIAHRCVPDWSEHTLEEVMDATSPAQLSDVVTAVFELSDIDLGNSTADQPDDSS